LLGEILLSGLVLKKIIPWDKKLERGKCVAMILIIVALILISAIIGYSGRHRKMGFWGYFFASIMLTPLIGLLLVMVSDSKKNKDS